MKKLLTSLSLIKSVSTFMVAATLMSATPASAESEVAADSMTLDKPSISTTVQHQSDRVNVNSADAESLAAGLKGIGLVKAEAIVAYRSEFGSFAGPDDLVKVKGIGEKTVERIQEQLAY